MREFAKEFYSSGAWQRCRDAYLKSVGGLCERCLSAGNIVAAEMVHHKIHLNEKNINDPNIALRFDNLEALCRDCHGKAHKKNIKRYRFDESGMLII